MADGFVGEDLVEANTAHVHAIGLTAIDYYRMARDNAKLIWSPRSDISLYGDTAQVQILARMGGTVALGTTWTATGSMTTTRELACAAELNRDYLGGYFTDRELWEMATINGAVALGVNAELGSLEVGKFGDISVFELGGKEPFPAIIETSGAGTALVLQAGEALYGEPDTLAVLRPGCETVDVCGTPRTICASAEFGTSWADLETALAAAYPATFCAATPENEPTCVPSRPGQYDGITATDADGDGLTDDVDLCPSVFSPVRPMDNGAQRDTDGDGEGDACDETPLLADYDADSLANDADLCPIDPDTAQDDSDGDGKGDVCDPCPEVSNPDRGCL